ncbi:hypothetical protein LRP67_11305 [Nocardioides sp. cx-169]|uniref:hypothetical protein n=1 Tax=Nocardioides sp. cx-169 TaxID=2899080 RepID=UPI001E3043FE|nr:hypothetical protein [Nocardioides sp. cx-169]MCD4534669.1 hypothetical protein [Nocardioides sp. cx-169]
MHVLMATEHVLLVDDHDDPAGVRRHPAAPALVVRARLLAVGHHTVARHHQPQHLETQLQIIGEIRHRIDVANRVGRAGAPSPARAAAAT